MTGFLADGWRGRIRQASSLLKRSSERKHEGATLALSPQATLEHLQTSRRQRPFAANVQNDSAKELHVQVTPLDRPLPPGEGWGEGLPATSVRSISSHPLMARI